MHRARGGGHGLAGQIAVSAGAVPVGRKGRRYHTGQRSFEISRENARGHLNSIVKRSGVIQNATHEGRGYQISRLRSEFIQNLTLLLSH